METFYYISTVLIFALGTGWIAYLLILGSSIVIAKELFNDNPHMSKNSEENVDFFFAKKE